MVFDSKMSVGVFGDSVVHIDVLSVPTRSSVRLCKYEHIKNYVFAFFENLEKSKLYIYIYV